MSRAKLHRTIADGVLERRGPRLLVDPRWSSGGDPTAAWRRRLFMSFCACGPRQRATAVVFRRSAAVLWGLDGLDLVDSGSPVELAVARGDVPAGSLFRVRPLRPAERTQRAGLPVTAVSRTLIDLGQVVEADIVERALESALRKGHVSVGSLRVALDEVRRVPGTSALRSLLDKRDPRLPPTASDAETLFEQLVRRAGLPAPLRQFVVVTPEGTFRLDFAWPAVRIAVEIDGAATHASGASLFRDLRRQNILMVALNAAGWLLLRFTWQDVACEPFAGQTIAKLLEAWSIGLRHSR